MALYVIRSILKFHPHDSETRLVVMIVIFNKNLVYSQLKLMLSKVTTYLISKI